MALFAFVPVADTIVIWLPAGIYLGLEGRWSEALVIAGAGSLVIRLIINIVYPVLVRNRLRAPSVTIFIALLGGVVLFGWSGLVLGPVIVTATGALLEICAKRFAGPELAVQSTGFGSIRRG
jgi:predicted PurR-regulated permease PerM